MYSPCNDERAVCLVSYGVSLSYYSTMMKYKTFLLLSLLPLVCCGQDLKYPYCTPQPNATPDPTSKAPPLPTFPDNYHIHVEANFLDAGFTIEASEYYDNTLNKAAIYMQMDAHEIDLIYSYGTNELFAIKDNVCRVSTLSDDDDRFLFGVQVNGGGKLHIYNTAGAFKFGQTYGETYKGQTQVRGMQVDHWQSCVQWDEINGYFTIDYYFTALNWSGVASTQQIPVRADVMGVAKNPDTSLRGFHHVYDFYHYRPNHDDQKDETEKYETPKGVVCPGRNSTRPLPHLQGQYFYRQEIVDPELKTVLTADVWYDSSYKLVRWDYRNLVSQPPIWNTHPLSEIHDFNTGVAYIIDKVLYNCTIASIEATAFDVVKSNISGPTSDPRWAVRMKSPLELFFLGDGYSYEGQRTVDGKLCDVFISIRTDFVLPGTDGGYNTTFEFYFLSLDWNQESNLGYSEGSDYPVKLEMSAPDVGYQATYNFYDFNEEHPDLSNFDITPCFDDDSLIDMQVLFQGRYSRTVDQNKKFFELEARLGLAQFAGISPIRLQRSEIHHNAFSFSLFTTLVERAPPSAKFHKYPNQVLQNMNDMTKPNDADPDVCAYDCLNEPSFECHSFDVCPDKNVCYLSRSSADDGQLIGNSRCDHYSATILGKTIVEMPSYDAFMLLKDMVYKNMIVVQVPIGAGKMQSYKAISIRDNIVRDPTDPTDTGPQLTQAAMMQQFTASRNKAQRSGNDDVLTGISVDDCATACVDEDIFVCQSFDYCFNTGDCHLSKRHPSEVPKQIISSQNCDLYSRNYTYKFTKMEGTILFGQTHTFYQGIDSPEWCAKMCSDLTKFPCKSFQFCDSIKVCALEKTHILDTPQSNVRQEPLCDHYSRNYIDDFKVLPGRQLALKNNQIIERVTVDNCAKICAEQGDSCLGFDYCGNDTYCRLTSDSVKNVGQVTIEPSAYCSHYARQYYADGSKITSYSVKHASNPSLVYGSGSMTGLAFAMIIIGVLCTAIGYAVYFMKIKGQSFDEMKQNIVTMDKLQPSKE